MDYGRDDDGADADVYLEDLLPGQPGVNVGAPQQTFGTVYAEQVITKNVTAANINGGGSSGSSAFSTRITTTDTTSATTTGDGTTPGDGSIATNGGISAFKNIRTAGEAFTVGLRQTNTNASYRMRAAGGSGTNAYILLEMSDGTAAAAPTTGNRTVVPAGGFVMGPWGTTTANNSAWLRIDSSGRVYPGNTNTDPLLASTSSGLVLPTIAPTTAVVGQIYYDPAGGGSIKVCTVAGTPGTFKATSLA